MYEMLRIFSFARKNSKNLSSEHAQKLLNHKKNWKQMHFFLQQIQLGSLLVIK